jgi:signal transduction histidine kinase
MMTMNSGRPTRPTRSIATTEPLAVLAHELRNPIGAIRNAVTVMEAAGAPPEAMIQARRLIARQAGRLSVLVDDLLDFASFARGTLSLRREWIDVVQEVEVAVESCSWALAESGHTLCLQVPGAPLHAYLDSTRLRQIVTNLLDNACKYTRPFGRIRLSLERVGENVIVGVEDNGSGIPSDRLPYVFDLFSRSTCTLESPVRGLGIGLALVREIVELHEGAVEARSDGPGRGSVFIVRMPICTSYVQGEQS